MAISAVSPEALTSRVDEIAALDADDPLVPLRAEFELPAGVIYLDGNSLGTLTRRARERVADVVTRQWGDGLIRAWNEHAWIDLPARVGAKIGALIGAEADTVVAADSTSVNLFKLLVGALKLRPDRRVILSDTGNFPTDLYIAEGVCKLLGNSYRLKTVPPEAVADAIDDSVAIVMLTEVDYRTGRLHDMKALTARAHGAGALALWDLAHSAGAMPVDLAAAKADFAVGCGYKYLNGGPGAPAFLYVAPKHRAAFDQPLSGWLGHDAPFAFELNYRPAAGIDRMRVGTPPVISMAALDAALDVFDGVNLDEIRRKSIGLTELFIREVEARCPDLALASPRDPLQRGSHVSFSFSGGYAVMRALIAHGVIGDFRAPDILRFGFTPLYLGYADVVRAAEILEDIMRDGIWRRPEYQTRAKVT